MRQKTLFKLNTFTSEFGGSLLTNQRKRTRPLSNKNPLKIVLKADSTRSPKLTHFRGPINDLFAKFSEKFNIRLYELAICGDHIHFVALFKSKLSYIKFIRALTGALAQRFSIKFKYRPWSRILAWGRGLKTAIAYTVQNHLEAIGAIPYRPRRKGRQEGTAGWK